MSDAAPPESERSPVREVLLVFAATTLGAAIATRLPALVPGVDGYEHLLVAGLFLVAAIKLAQREPGGMRRHGIDLAGLLQPPDPDDARDEGPFGGYDLARAVRRAMPAAIREGGIAVAIAALVFPPFVVGFAWWHGPTRDFAFTLPDDLAAFALTQLLVVALPEEALFRGWIQTRLHDRWPPERRVLGVALDWRVWILQAALFALVHVATIPHPARLAVFFPGLLFGWMRAWRGGIGAAMLLHALSNVLAEILEKGWLL